MDMAIELLGTFGKRLRVLREEHGMDQTEFAAAVSRRLGRQTLSNSSVSSMESGRSRPSLDVLLAILRELDVSADYLLFGDGSPNRSEEIAEPPIYYAPEADEAARPRPPHPRRFLFAREFASHSKLLVDSVNRLC